MSLAQRLTPEKALIFRITHRDNIPWILDNGMWCASAGMEDPAFVTIGQPELIAKRPHKAVPVPPGGTLSDYVPFYFTPYSPMLYRIVTGRGVKKRAREEIVVLVSSLHDARRAGCRFVFSDRHAYLGYLTAANFSSDLADLDRMIPWQWLWAQDFRHDPEQPEKKERYQAEALIHRYMPLSALKGLVVYDEPTAQSLRAGLQARGLAVPVYVRPGWFFR